MSRSVAPGHSAFLKRGFEEAGGFVTSAVPPRIEPGRVYVPCIRAVRKARYAIVPPGACQEYGLRRYVIIAGESAPVEAKASVLFETVGGSGDKADVPVIICRPDLAVCKDGITAAEDEIDCACDPAAVKPLRQWPVLPEGIDQEAIIPLDEILGERTQEQGVLSGDELTTFHAEAVSVYA